MSGSVTFRARCSTSPCRWSRFDERGLHRRADVRRLLDPRVPARSTSPTCCCMPDPTTAVLDPFRQHDRRWTSTFFVHDPLTGEPYSRDPRNIARKAQDFLVAPGSRTPSFFGPEAEFYIFDSARFATEPNEGYYHLDSIEGAWNTGRDEDGGNLGYKPRYKGGYFPVPPMDHYTDLRVGDGPRCSSGAASRWRCSTTRSAPLARRRSTSASTPLLHMADKHDDATSTSSRAWPGRQARP